VRRERDHHEKNCPLMKELPSPVVAPFAPWPKDLLCALCESLAFFVVKFFFTAKLAKNCRQERKAKPHGK
jgi:hypothetical protein